MATDKAKGILDKIKAMFSAAEATIEHKLADGKTMKMDKQEVGGKVFIDNLPVTEAGEFALADKTKIAYDATGLITSITPYKFIDYTLADGTVLTCDQLAVGGMATVAGAPAPAGDYTLPDGTIVSIDATGAITAVVPAAAPADTVDMTTPEGMRRAYEKFATGIIDAAGMSVIIKALMEYCFGWQLREAQEKATKDEALKVYQQSLATTQAAVASANEKVIAQSAMMKQMFELMNEVVGLPTDDVPGAGGKKKFSFANVEGRKKSFEKFQSAAKALGEQWKKMEKVA